MGAEMRIRPTSGRPANPVNVDSTVSRGVSAGCGDTAAARRGLREWVSGGTYSEERAQRGPHAGAGPGHACSDPRFRAPGAWHGLSASRLWSDDGVLVELREGSRKALPFAAVACVADPRAALQTGCGRGQGAPAANGTCY